MRIKRQYRGVPLWVMRNYLTELNGKYLLGQKALPKTLKPAYRRQTKILQEPNTRF